MKNEQLVLLPKTRDVKEFQYSVEYEGNKYFCNILITGQKEAVSGLEEPLEVGKRQFKEDIKNSLIHYKDNVVYGFYSKGSFVKKTDNTLKLDIECKIAKYGSDRFHIEIPKEFHHIIHEGDSVKIIK